MFTLALASLLTTGVIAVNRYFCVVKPVKYIVLFNRQRILMCIVAVWCLALVGSVPPFLFEKGGYKFQPYTNIVYTAYIACVYIATPLTLIVICYAKVSYKVFISNQVFSNKNKPQQLRANVDKAKVTKTFAAVVADFAFCWLPIFIMDFIDTAREETHSAATGLLNIRVFGLPEQYH